MRYSMSKVVPVPMKSCYNVNRGDHKNYTPECATWWQWRGRIWKHRINAATDDLVCDCRHDGTDGDHLHTIACTERMMAADGRCPGSGQPFESRRFDDGFWRPCSVCGRRFLPLFGGRMPDHRQDHTDD